MVKDHSVPGKRPSTATDRVVTGLTHLIRTELIPGARLPSENVLADAYAVSRLTVREAVKVLSGRGLLDVARGRRARVRQPDSVAFGHFLAMAAEHDAKSFFDIIEVRQALEVQSAILAAKRVNRAALAAIESALDGMIDAVVDIENGADRAAAETRFNRLDVGFHGALALSSGNRMLTMLLEAMAAPLEESFRMSTRGRTLRGQSHQATLAAHRAILDGVRNGDGRAAAQAMRAHLKEAEQDLRAAFGRSGG